MEKWDHTRSKLLKSKKWLRPLVAVVLGVFLGVLVSSACQQKLARAFAETTIAIMSTADLQSAIAPYTVDDDGRDLTVGGLERVASAARKVRSEVDGSLLLSSGDDMIPPLLSMFHGEPEMRGMSLAGYDIATPGNHEFDMGTEVYRNAFNFASFEVVSADLIIDNHEIRDRISSYVVRNIAGIKVGAFGMMRL